MKHVMAKFGSMRKPDECVVYPDSGDGIITIQGDRLIAQFNAETGEGMLNYKGSNSKYFYHLSSILGAERFTFSQEFIAECKAAQPKRGDLIGAGMVIG